jgi:predicted transcriptional regulator
VITSKDKIIGMVTETSLMSAMVNKKLKKEDPVKKCLNKEVTVFDKQAINLAQLAKFLESRPVVLLKERNEGQLTVYTARNSDLLKKIELN